MLRILVLLAIAAAFAPSLRAQSDEPDLIATLTELRYETFAGRALADVPNALYEGMEIVDSERSRVSADRARAVLSVEQQHIERLLDATKLSYEVPPIPPQDPLNEDPGPYQHLGTMRHTARVFAYDARHKWMSAEFDASLERVVAVLRLADLLIESEQDLSLMSGSALRGMAYSLVDDMASAADATDQPPVFSADALDSLRTQLESRPSADPEGYAALAVRSITRHERWMRDRFVGDQGASLFREYVEQYGHTEDALLEFGAKIVSAPETPEFMIRFFSDDETESRAAINEHWDSLGDEERAAAIESYKHMFSEPGWSPYDTIPRLRSDGTVQTVQAAEIEARLDQLIDGVQRLERADSREEIREALAVIRMQIDADETQITRIGAGLSGLSAPFLWQKSVRLYDDALAALDRLEEYVGP